MVARRHGVPRDHVKGLLAHVEGDVTAVYDQYEKSAISCCVISAERLALCGRSREGK
jgi:hypothetical protein